MRLCVKCNVEKDSSEFGKRTDGKDGLRRECKVCFNKYYREYFSKKDNMKKQGLRVKENKKEYRWRLHQYKLETGCFICGYKKCVSSLHFHHLNPETKEFGINQAARHRISQDRLDQEIQKCVLLCANCHGEVEEGLAILQICK